MIKKSWCTILMRRVLFEMIPNDWGAEVFDDGFWWLTELYYYHFIVCSFD